ncbi:hypothetical protein [Pseudobacillus badius]|uniref:hypothetical protein n=1 Tax=Bacillus badius TaxID=1455 RepID=UPI000A594002|nr:hypothetical protein [Bacillus badius]
MDKVQSDDSHPVIHARLQRMTATKRKKGWNGIAMADETAESKHLSANMWFLESPY